MEGKKSKLKFRVTGAGISEATVREQASFQIETYDDQEKLIYAPAECEFFIAIRGVSQVRARVTDTMNGTWIVTWQPKQSGRYRITVSCCGIPLPGSPFMVIAYDPEPCPSKCVVRGDALTSGIAREVNTFLVTFKDKLGVVTHAVDLDVFAEPLALGSPRGPDFPGLDKSAEQLAVEKAEAEKAAAEKAATEEAEKKEAAQAAARAKKHGRASRKADAIPPPSTAPEPTQVVETAETPEMSSSFTRSGVTRRRRRIRIRVGDKPLVVRSGYDLESPQIGHLLPGSMATVVEERIAPGGGVRACVALDYLIKHDGTDLKTERASTHRSSGTSTFRASPSTRQSTPSMMSSSGLDGSGLSSRHLSRLTRVALEGGGSSSRGNGSSSSYTQPTVLAEPVEIRAQLAKPRPQQNTPTVLAEPVQVRADLSAPQGVSSQSRVQQRLGLKLDVSSLGSQSSDLIDRMNANCAGGQPLYRGNAWLDEDQGLQEGSEVIEVEEAEGSEIIYHTGWVTLVKNGKKLVSSRLRLDPCRRNQFEDQWKRRMQTDTKCVADDKLEAQSGEQHTPAQRAALALERSASLTANYAMELSTADKTQDPAAFAFGGVYPGRLHSHGKLHETHKASYSVGVAGQYLLHVRLRKQARALPGSPFLLTIKAGPAFAMSTTLPKEIHGEVGGACVLEIVTGDKMGNPCSIGGSNITVDSSLDPTMTTNTKTKAAKDVKEEVITAVVQDKNDGRYGLVLKSHKIGIFYVTVKIDGLPVLNSPMKVHLTSTEPDLRQTIISGEGIKQVIKGETGVFFIRFLDKYGNRTIQTPAFRERFVTGMCLVAPGMGSAQKSRHETFNEWVEDPLEPCYALYKVSFCPTSAGTFSMFIWWENEPGSRNNFPGSPYPLNVHSNAKDQIVSQEVLDTSGITSGDYKIALPVFQAAQQRWCNCTIDAFASAATSMLPRFWTQEPDAGGEAGDALKQIWPRGERIWAHPPGEKNEYLHKVVVFMESKKRLSETVVVVPFRPTCDWYYRLTALSDSSEKYMAGRLQRVAKDAPARIETWPIMLFHVPEVTEEQEKAREAAPAEETPMFMTTMAPLPDPTVLA